MPKTQFINPAGCQKIPDPGTGIHPGERSMTRSMKEELSRFSKDDLVRIYRDMLIIREFETMLNLIKTTGEYKGYPLFSSGTGPPFHRTGSSRGGDGLHAGHG